MLHLVEYMSCANCIFINYCRLQIRVSDNAEKEMDRLWEDQLVCTSDNIFTRGQSDINLLHINICNLRRKVADINCDEL